ncbi:MAG: T9SS type A sorting domain-containing protein [candidate division WOR-3 bacterium]
MKKILLIVWTTILLSFAVLSQTHLTVFPGTTVEVGEEVYFDAIYYARTISDTLEFEWDFGDGYRMYIDTSDGNPFESGVAVVHYFMKPGVYTVKMEGSYYKLVGVSKPVKLNTVAVDSVVITVTGEAPIAGFEVLRAPFHGRVAQYLYAKVPAGYSPSQVSARIEKVGGGYSEELVGTTVDTLQRFLLRNAQLPMGDYVITFELKSGQSVVSRIREKFTKPYNGAPVIGIDENNAFVLNGTTYFFPIGPFMSSNTSLLSRVSTALHTEGYYPSHNPSTWVDYISQGRAYNLMTIGPTRWEGFISEPAFYKRNSKVDSIVIYVQTAKNEQGLFAWCWCDEPELGGRWAQVPTQVLAAWAYRTRLEDPHHLATNQLYGYSYQRYRKPKQSNTLSAMYMYRHNAPWYGGKRHFYGDFYTHDAYPLEAQEHASFKDSTAGIFELWFENLDVFRWVNCDLIPLGACVETQNVTSCSRMDQEDYTTSWDAGPTPDELRMELWGAVVHGMKAIVYFDLFSPTPAENFSVMGEFKETITALTPVIFSVPSTRVMTHNCNTRGNRVDIMVREHGNDVYVFAVRVSEPEGEWDEVYEPEKIRFELNTGINISKAYDELSRYRWSYVKLDATEGQKEFSCVVPEGSIVPGSVIISAVINSAASQGYPDSLVDQHTGKKYPTALDIVGNLKYGYDDGNGNIIPHANYGGKKLTGAVNYSTGQIQFSFETGIPEGKGFVQVAYAPGNRQAREVSINNGVISEDLERNAVRIYRIPLDSTGGEGNGPGKFKLYQNSPNPFDSTTVIRYEIPKEVRVILKMYDLLGREVTTLVDEIKGPGRYDLKLNGEKIPSGIYFYRMIAGEFEAVKKMILIK